VGRAKNAAAPETTNAGTNALTKRMNARLTNFKSVRAAMWSLIMTRKENDMDLIGLIEKTASREELVKLLRDTEEKRQQFAGCLAKCEYYLARRNLGKPALELLAEIRRAAGCWKSERIKHE
jgi:hypothetical protein